MAANPLNIPATEPASPMRDAAFKSVVDISVEGYKQVGLMHGGAIIVIITIAGHAATKPALPGILLCGGIFAIGLWINIESLMLARMVQIALMNRETHRAWGIHFLAAGNQEFAQQRQDSASAEDTKVTNLTIAAFKYFRWSLGLFLLGSAATLLTIYASLL
jgi:hypothetical protein